MDQRRMHFERRREYPMSVDEAWRLLADTDHLNRTIGLPAVTFSPLDGPAGRFTRDARARAFGVVSLSWTEYPFDWVRGRGYRVRREFTRGPLAVVEAGVELAPAEGGVRVTAYADYVPANWTGRFLWRLGNATVADLLAFCDEYLARREAGKPDPVPVPRRRPSVDRARLDRVSGALASAPLTRSRRARSTDGRRRGTGTGSGLPASRRARYSSQNASRSATVALPSRQRNLPVQLAGT